MPLCPRGGVGICTPYDILFIPLALQQMLSALVLSQLVAHTCDHPSNAFSLAQDRVCVLKKIAQNKFANSRKNDAKILHVIMGTHSNAIISRQKQGASWREVCVRPHMKGRVTRRLVNPENGRDYFKER